MDIWVLYRDHRYGIDVTDDVLLLLVGWSGVY
jgi:hypothetical protein